tara:strand:+ start:221 stop:451 length:231 start_codon:yes stop_codon:yes gene_type:complete
MDRFVTPRATNTATTRTTVGKSQRAETAAPASRSESFSADATGGAFSSERSAAEIPKSIAAATANNQSTVSAFQWS